MRIQAIFPQNLIIFFCIITRITLVLDFVYIQITKVDHHHRDKKLCSCVEIVVKYKKNWNNKFLLNEKRFHDRQIK